MPQRLPRNLCKSAGQLDTGRAAADEDKREQLLTARGIGLALGPLERKQHTPPDLERVLERLEPRRVSRPLLVPEIGMARARGHDQKVVVEHGAVGQDDPAAGRLDRAGLAKQHANVCGAPEDPSDRRGDIAWRERRGGNLIEQRLEQMVVVAIEQRDAHVMPSQDLRRRQPAEAAADDDDMWVGHFINA